MAFLRFNRDRRGYEHFYLVESSTNRRGKTRARVLYWFRTPPNLRVGREPFSDDVQRALEQQYPNVAFDWKKIIETPIPSAETERWRERRRMERALRRSQEGTAPQELTEDDEVPAEETQDAEEPEDAEDSEPSR